MAAYQKEYNKKADTNSKLVQCRTIFEFNEGLAPFQDEQKKWGYLNTKGEIVIPCQYKYADYFCEGLAAVGNDNDLYGFINKTGSLIIPHKYGFAEDFKDGLAVVEDNESQKAGYIDKAGKLIIPYKYDYACSFSDGLAVVFKETEDSELAGYINKQGEHVVDYKYIDASDFINGYANAETDDKFIVLNKNGEEIYKKAITEDNDFRHCGAILMYRENDNNTWEFHNLDTNTKSSHPNIQKIACVIDNLCVVVNTEGKYGALDAQGQITIPFIYNHLGTPSEELISFTKDKLQGFIDYNNREVIAAQYKTTSHFTSGLSKVTLGNTTYFINKYGEKVLTIKKRSNFKKFIPPIIIAIVMIYLILENI